MNEQQQLKDVLAEIHKQLVMIANSLATLAKVARHQHPEAFTKEARPPAPQAGDRK